MNQQEFTIALHNKLVEAVDLLIHYYNPCRLEGGKCRVSDPNQCCVGTRFGKGACPFFNRGCTNVNLDCKLWFCGTSLAGMDPDCRAALLALESIGKRYGLVRPPYLGEPYAGCDQRFNR